MSTNKPRKNYSKIAFLLAGLLMLIKFLIEGGVPSTSDVLNFIVGVFTLIVLVGFYCYFVFAQQNCKGTIKVLAPAILLIILYGKYSFNFGSAKVNNIFNGIITMTWTLIIICGFVYMFIHEKLVGMVLAISTGVYATFIGISYIVMVIINLVNNGSFNVTNCISTFLLITSYIFIAYGAYKTAKTKEW